MYENTQETHSSYLPFPGCLYRNIPYLPCIPSEVFHTDRTRNLLGFSPHVSVLKGYERQLYIIVKIENGKKKRETSVSTIFK